MCLEKRRPLTAVSYQYLVYYLAYYLEYDDIPSRDRHRGRLDTVNNHRLHYCICDVIGARRHTRQGTSLVLTGFMERGVPFWLGECHEAHCHRNCTKNFAVDMYVFEHRYTYVCIYIMGIFGTQKYVYNNFRRDGGQSSWTVWHNDCPRIT